MDETIARLVSDLESQAPISLSFLNDLEVLLDYTLNTNDSIDFENLCTEISSRNLSLSSLTNAISSAMDSGPTNLSLFGSKVYLSLLISPNSPVFTLFTPMAFLSLLRVVRRAFKKLSGVSSERSGSRSQGAKKKGRKNVGQRKNSAETRVFLENEEREGGFEVKDLLCVLERLEMVLGLVHLGRFPDCLKGLIQTVCEIPVMAVDFSQNLVSFGRLCELCSRVLSEVLKAEHGNQGDSAAEVLKALTPLILLTKSQTRSFGLGFVVNRMVGMGRNSGEIKKAILNLPKHMVRKAPEKAEPRGLAVESIMEVVKALDFEDQVEFADYVVKMSQGNAQFRLLAVDLIPVLMVSMRDPLGLDSDDGFKSSWGLRCLEALIQRCSDITPGIRAKALTNLAQLVGSLSGIEKSRSVLKEVMGFENEMNMSSEGGLNDLLQTRCMDEKAAVRKAALVLVSKLTALLCGELDEELLKTVGTDCSDPLVSIRKVAITALSEVFRIHLTHTVAKEWLHSVPRLITDNESSIQEECENLFLELVLDRVSNAGSTSSSCNESLLHELNDKKNSLDMKIELLYPEGVLGLLKEICDGEVAPWVKKICTSLGKKKRLRPNIAISLQNIIKTSESLWLNHSNQIQKWTAPPGAWFLLSEVSAFLPKAVDWEFLHHHWQLLDKYKPVHELKSPLEQDVNEGIVDVESNSLAWAGDRVFLLQTISNVSVELPPEPAADLAHNFLKRLEEFNMHTTEVNAHVKALKTLCKRKALHSEEADSLVIKWVQQLLSKASQVLDMYLSKIADANKDSAFLTPQTLASEKGTREAATSSTLESRSITAVYTIGSLIVSCASADLKAIIPVLYTIITSGSSDRKSNRLHGAALPLKQTTPSLYIQAWLTMGKICLADGKLAKRYLPLFVQELEKSDCAALRNNIVVIMADFCVRYTALVDCYMLKITKCLRDTCELVRRQTFILLSRLLQRDYVKWRGVLFLRFLLCLVDDSEKIRQLADFLFGNILKAKAPLLAYNSFVEAIFVLNDCNAHTGRSNAQSLRNETRPFSIRGNDENSRSKRMHIYITLLKQMAPEHLLATFAKVCAEILAAASDGMLCLEDVTGQSVLQQRYQNSIQPRIFT
ncbi:condensin-2 complex subunit D3 [Olea europaea subsp. europaea]|uniref:Condensin-2 complex subunit D3 n=1 Tax=Olea europaea subsp. europaea TaxID=158383 RepID=A0A8S0RV51_OLEEU|nr:condensin-2 complex subunit D3 [Olea europaea subsp. europaea]